MELHIELEGKERLTPIGFAEAVIDSWLAMADDPDGLEMAKANLWEIERHIEIFLIAARHRKDLKVHRVYENGKV